ncbi:hypothetical protein HK098_001546 [Nowakowskiella sp. JEL0407]|nr:hypothetical protein HK098_001546 [Nowakowskiella sp. JEL0407]
MWGCYSKINRLGELETPLQCESETGKEMLRCIENAPSPAGVQKVGGIDSTTVVVEPPIVDESKCKLDWTYKGFTFRGCSSVGAASPDSLWCMLKDGEVGAPTDHIPNASSPYWGLCDPNTVRKNVYGSMSNGTIIKCDSTYTGGIIEHETTPFKVAGCLAPITKYGNMMGPYMCKGQGVDYLVQCVETTNGASVFATEEGAPYPTTVKPSECLDTFTFEQYSIQGCSNHGGVEWCYVKNPFTGFDGTLKYAVCDVNYMAQYYGRDSRGNVKKCASMRKMSGSGKNDNFVVFGCVARLNSDGSKAGPHTCLAEGSNEELVCLSTDEQTTMRAEVKVHGLGSITGLAGNSTIVTIIVVLSSILVVVGLVFGVMWGLRYRKKIKYQQAANDDNDEDSEKSLVDGEYGYKQDSTVVFEAEEEEEEEDSKLMHK